MLQKQSLRLDESQEIEGQQLRERLQYELEILTAYQSKNRINAQTQRDRERKQLDDRVSVRRSLLESKVTVNDLYQRTINWNFDLFDTDGIRAAAVRKRAG